MLADRSHHVRTVIEPTLENGGSVVSDRYFASTLAYQGYGRGVDLARLEAATELAIGSMPPRHDDLDRHASRSWPTNDAHLTRATDSSRPTWRSTSAFVRATSRSLISGRADGASSTAPGAKQEVAAQSTNVSPLYHGEMSDVFDSLVGQDGGCAAMRQYVKSPVHAYSSAVRSDRVCTTP